MSKGGKEGGEDERLYQCLPHISTSVVGRMLSEKSIGSCIERGKDNVCNINHPESDLPLASEAQVGEFRIFLNLFLFWIVLLE